MPKKINVQEPGNDDKYGMVVYLETSEERKQRLAAQAKFEEKIKIEEEWWKAAPEISGREFFPVLWRRTRISKRKKSQLAGYVLLKGRRCYVIPASAQKGGERNIKEGTISSCRLNYLRNLTGGNGHSVYTVDVIIADIAGMQSPEKKETAKKNLVKVEKEIVLPQEFMIEVNKGKTYVITSGKLVAREIKLHLEKREKGWFTNFKEHELVILKALNQKEIEALAEFIQGIQIKI